MDVEKHISSYRAKLRKAKLVFLAAQLLVVIMITAQAVIFRQVTGSLISIVIHILLTLYAVHLWRKVHKAIDTEDVKNVMET